MKTILITGARGFLGRNLTVLLRQTNPENDLLLHDVEGGEVELQSFAACADFVFHLAGVNRPENPDDFLTGNRDLTARLLGHLEATGRRIPVLLSSSTQAERDNPYGTSKRLAEEAVFEYGRRTGASTYVFRLPNVFGKWSRPDYNSVVATWCHRIARDLPIQVSDPSQTIRLAYVMDVIEEWLPLPAQDPAQEPCGDGPAYRSVAVSTLLALSELERKLRSFRRIRGDLVLPDFSDPFDRKLYATYLSFLPEDGFASPLELKRDARGWLSEFLKSPSAGQIFVSRTKPGITRGNHGHHTKAEKFLVISGEGVVRLRRLDRTEVLEYPVSGDSPTVVDIPPGYTHSIENTGETDLLTLFWADEIFDPAAPDTLLDPVR